MTNFSRQRGFGLIEVLVAVLILAIGILGLVGMQLSGKRAGHEAVQRTMATALARDITSRMRLNPNELTGYVVTNIGNGSRGTEPAENCKTTSCTSAQLATHDLWEWEQALDGSTETIGIAKVGGLVSPRACITHAAGVVTVAIAWRGYESIANPTASDCGEGLGLYDSTPGAGDDANRQLLVVTTFIQDI